MLSLRKTLARSALALARSMDRGQYEQTESGILFPVSKLMFAGEYRDSVNGIDLGISKNLLTTEGMNHILMVALGATAKISNWYLGLSGANATPLLTWTAANWAANATEITSNTEGYSETTRRGFTAGTASGGVIDNYASRAQFTIATATSVVVYGAGLLSLNTKGGTTGVLISSVKYASARTFVNGDLYNCGYRVTATNTP